MDFDVLSVPLNHKHQNSTAQLHKINVIRWRYIVLHFITSVYQRDIMFCVH